MYTHHSAQWRSNITLMLSIKNIFEWIHVNLSLDVWNKKLSVVISVMVGKWDNVMYDVIFVSHQGPTVSMATCMQRLAQPKPNRLQYPDRYAWLTHVPSLSIFLSLFFPLMHRLFFLSSRSVYWLNELPPEKTRSATTIGTLLTHSRSFFL